MKMKHKRKATQDRARSAQSAKQRPKTAVPSNEADDPFHGQTSDEPLDTDFDREVGRRVIGYDE